MEQITRRSALSLFGLGALVAITGCDEFEYVSGRPKSESERAKIKAKIRKNLERESQKNFVEFENNFRTLYSVESTDGKTRPFQSSLGKMVSGQSRCGYEITSIDIQPFQKTQDNEDVVILNEQGGLFRTSLGNYEVCDTPTNGAVSTRVAFSVRPKDRRKPIQAEYSTTNITERINYE